MFDDLLDLPTCFVVGEVYEKDGFVFIVAKRTRCYVSFMVDGREELIKKKIKQDIKHNDYVLWRIDNGPDAEPSLWILHSCYDCAKKF